MFCFYGKYQEPLIEIATRPHPPSKFDRNLHVSTIKRTHDTTQAPRHPRRRAKIFLASAAL